MHEADTVSVRPHRRKSRGAQQHTSTVTGDAEEGKVGRGVEGVGVGWCLLRGDRSGGQPPRHTRVLL